MKNLNDLQVLILTLAHVPFRRWYMLGVLNAMDYHEDFCHAVSGRYWGDYESGDALIDGMLEDGFSWADRLRTPMRNGGVRFPAFAANLWSTCRSLRHIASQDNPCLLIEDDHVVTMKHKTLITRLEELPGHAEIAILRPPEEPIDSDEGTTHWVTGHAWIGSGAYVNIYTPKGAQIALDVASEKGISYEVSRTSLSKRRDVPFERTRVF